MKKNEIIVGREVSKGEFTVEDRYKSVSRTHAKIMRKSDGLYLEDLDSRCGTFVNGTRISSKKITLSDKISFGGADYYVLNLNKILELLPMSDEEFREKFLYLKQVYDNYTEKIEALEKKTQLYSRVFGMAPLSLGGVVVSGISLYFRNLYIVALGGLIAILGLILGGQISSKLSAKIKKEVKQLQEEFRQDYFCPDCANELGTHNSWNYLKNKGKCPYCKREWNV